MTREERDAIRARCEAATSGPWEYDGMHNEIQTPYSENGFWLICSEVRTHPSEKILDEFGHTYNPDFEFIANARQDIPALLDALDEAEAHAERVCTYIEFCEGDPHDDDHCSWYCKCSECGNIEYSEPRYCPGCGAKINKEVE